MVCKCTAKLWYVVNNFYKVTCALLALNFLFCTSWVCQFYVVLVQIFWSIKEHQGASRSIKKHQGASWSALKLYLEWSLGFMFYYSNHTSIPLSILCCQMFDRGFGENRKRLKNWWNSLIWRPIFSRVKFFSSFTKIIFFFLRAEEKIKHCWW